MRSGVLRHCCIEPSRDTGAARSSPELRQRAAGRAHRAALVAKMGDLGPDASVAQEDFPSRDHLNAQCNSAIRSSPSLVTPTVVAGPSRRTVTAESETQGQSWNGLAPKKSDRSADQARRCSPNEAFGCLRNHPVNRRQPALRMLTALKETPGETTPSRGPHRVRLKTDHRRDRPHHVSSRRAG